MIMFRLQNRILRNGLAQPKKVQIHRNFSTVNVVNKIEPDEKNFQTSWNNAKPFSAIPGPNVFQMIRGFLPGGKYHNIQFLEMHRRIRDEFGSIVRMPAMLGNEQIVMSYDAGDYESVFRTEGIWPDRRGIQTFNHYRQKIRPDIFKNVGGLLNDQGESWAKMRSLVNPIMLKPATVNLYVPTIDSIAIEFVERLKTLRDENMEMPANFGYELSKWALESISSVAFEERLHILDGKSDENNRSMQLIQAVHDFFELSFELEVSPSLWRYYPTKKYKQLMKTFDQMTETTMYFIDQAIIKLENKTHQPSDKEPSVLEKLLKLDKHIAMVMALDMLMAGVDTTSSSVGNFLYHLAKHPEKQEKLRQEIRTVVLPNSSDTLTATSFRSIPYMRACLKEVQRLTPIVLGNARKTTVDLVIQGYQVPKGMDVAMANMLLQNEEKYFKQSKEFIPERWLKESMPDACPASKATNPFVYLPFGFGPRSCIGRRFAELEIYSLVARIFSQFRVEYDYGPLKYRNSFVISPIGDMKFKLIDI